VSNDGRKEHRTMKIKSNVKAGDLPYIQKPGH
jgi:hypothetical protein